MGEDFDKSRELVRDVPVLVRIAVGLVTSGAVVEENVGEVKGV
jgi:hypothetical protein